MQEACSQNAIIVDVKGTRITVKSGKVQIDAAEVIINGNTTVNGNVYHYKVKNEQAAGGNTTSSTNYDILWNNLFNLGKYTRIQLDGSFVGPSVTTQGRTDAYWYANVAVRQQLCNRKLTATLASGIFSVPPNISAISKRQIYAP